jgi:sugar/nucleoside kinase (ribokinase family)
MPNPVSDLFPEVIFAGPLRTEFLLTPDGRHYYNILGGSCLYAGVGARIWDSKPPGLIARVGENFPTAFLNSIRAKGLNIDGVRVLPQKQPTDVFYYFKEWDQCIDWDPVKYYARRNLPCPPELLEYAPPSIGEGRTSLFPDIAIRREDIPDSYRQARAAYIAPCHYLSQITLSVAMRQNGLGTICLSISKGLCQPSGLPYIRKLLHGIDIFFAQEENLEGLFQPKVRETREISERIAGLGPKIILLQKDLQGISVYDADSKKMRFLPFYPAEIKNPIGVGDSFCGGFLISWRKNYDPIESTLWGCVSASLSVEGVGGLYALDRNPGLPEARLSSLRSSYTD